MTCTGCRKAITVKGCCYDCAREGQPWLPVRTIVASASRFHNQSTPTKWGAAA